MLGCASWWWWTGALAICSVANSLKPTSLTPQPRTHTSDFSHLPH